MRQKNNIDPSHYTASGCQVRFAWRVYLEPIAGQEGNDVLEYFLTRKGGRVVATNKLSGRTLDGQSIGGNQAPTSITQANAITIARKDATQAHDVANKQLTVCELRSFWRIIFAPPLPLNGGGPEYLIDKRTGRITDKKNYQ